jgi:NAD(P)-dependent dehydrogenase (short-subunit alcohol dehydrogenase family)
MKTALITGASRGIGRGLALAFGAAGYQVAVNFVANEGAAAEVLQKIPNALLVPCDVRDSLRVRQMVDAVLQKWGSLDVLINNAGITRDRTILKMTNGEWNEVIDVNLNGVFWCLREAGRVMVEKKKGHIINISSRLAQRPIVGAANYSASKAAVVALTQSAALEFGRWGVQVNAIFPGFHATDMGARLPPKAQERVQSEHILGHSTRIEDLVSFVLSLVENQSVSGQVFNVDNRMI